MADSTTAKRPKNLVVFCDGTWNEPEGFIHASSSSLSRALRQFRRLLSSASHSDTNDLAPVTNVIKLMRVVNNRTEDSRFAHFYQGFKNL
jgi:hypothetical protein